MNKKFILSIIFLVLVGVGGYLLLRNSPTNTADPINTDSIDATGTDTDIQYSYSIDEIHSPSGGYIGHIKTLSSSNLTIDKVIWLNCNDSDSDTGDCPNGYKLDKGDDLSLMKFDVSSDVQVRLATYSHNKDGSFMFGQKVSLAEFIKIFNNPTPEYPAKDLLFQIVLKDNKVIKIQEQYQP
jgi:hypothetical protein